MRTGSRPKTIRAAQKGIARMQGNLFVVSRVGQVRNVQTFITAFGATNNHLAVLYTAANPTLSDGIRSAIRDELFSEVTFVEQPLRPVTQGRKKNAVIASQIDGLLRGALDAGVTDVYLCNANAYYSLFERLIDSEGYTLSLNLLEEGLTTYMILGRRPYARDLTASWVDVKRLGKKVVTNPSKLPYRLLAFALGLASWALRTDVVTRVKELRVRLLVPARLRYGHVSHFKRAYVYFPDKVSGAITRVDEVHDLPFALEPTAPPALLAAVRDDSAMFVSQKYIAQGPYLAIVFRILHEMGLEHVVFKLHPREDPADYRESVAHARSLYPELDVQAPAEVQAIPAEELMMARKTPTVIGLTSTALMYARAFFPGVRAISIGERFRELAQSPEYGITKRELSEFVRDLDVFADVSGVEQFHPASDGPSEP